MDQLIEYVFKLNWQSIIGMFGICYYFTHALRKDMHDVRDELKEQGKRIDRLYEMFIDLLKEKKS